MLIENIFIEDVFEILYFIGTDVILIFFFSKKEIISASKKNFLDKKFLKLQSITSNSKGLGNFNFLNVKFVIVSNFCVRFVSIKTQFCVKDRLEQQ